MRLSRLLPAAVLAVLLASPADAAQRPITGSLAKNGYTVIALGYDGQASSAVVKRGRFRVVPPAGKVTLNLRNAKGVYAGPVAVGKRGKRLVVGVRAGAALGKLKLAKGFAQPRRKLRAKFAEPSRTAVTRKGAPAGAGRFGLVRGRAVGASGSGRDADFDGVPGAFDIDDDGDLVLDNNDRSGGARIAQVPPGPMGEPAGSPSMRLFSNFHFNVSETLNANAGGVTREQIDAAMTKAKSFVGLVFFLPTGVDSAELDCGGLSYCSSGGTGHTQSLDPFADGPAFPACCDEDGDGWGTITRGPTGDFQLVTLAPSNLIGSGDTFVEHFTAADGSDQQLTGSLNYMFNTTPAVKAYVDGSGAGATVAYPAPPNAPGTTANPLALQPDANGEYRLSLELWRPQRDAISEAGEPAGFVDIGGLSYTVSIPNAPSDPSSTGGPQRGPGNCNLENFTSSHPDLQQTESPYERIDAAADTPSDPANTLIVEVNFTKCAAQAGQTLSPGSRFNWSLGALSSANDVAAQEWVSCVPATGQSTCPAMPLGPPAGPPAGPPTGPPTGPAAR